MGRGARHSRTRRGPAVASRENPGTRCRGLSPGRRRDSRLHPGSGCAGTSRAGVSNAQPHGRPAVIDGPAVSASTDTVSQPPADAVQHALRAVETTARRTVAERVRHVRSRCRTPPSGRGRPRTSGRSPSRARCAATAGRSGRSRRAARRSVPGRAARWPRRLRTRRRAPCRCRRRPGLRRRSGRRAGAARARRRCRRPGRSPRGGGAPRTVPQPAPGARGRSAVAGRGREERLRVAVAAARRRVCHEELLLDDPQVAPGHREVRLCLVEHQVQERVLP